MSAETLSPEATIQRPMMEARSTPIQVANFFIDRGLYSGEAITHLKLQKLLYVAYGWYLAQFGKPLFHEPLQAWRYGPVILSIYMHLKHYGSNSITQCISASQAKSQATMPNPADHVLIRFLNDIWSGYSSHSADELTDYSHATGSPWFKVVSMWKSRGASVPLGYDIPDELITDYFKGEKARLSEFNPGIRTN